MTKLILNAAQRYKLTRWVDVNRDEVMMTTDQDLAAKASVDLGEMYTHSHVANARKALGMAKKSPPTGDEMKVRDAKFFDLCTIVAMVAAAICDTPTEHAVLAIRDRGNAQ